MPRRSHRTPQTSQVEPGVPTLAEEVVEAVEQSPEAESGKPAAEPEAPICTEPQAKEISRIMSLMPRVCAIIDPLTPRLLIECTYEGLDRKVREIFSEVTKGEDWSTANIDEFYAAWDPRKAAKGRLDALR